MDKKRNFILELISRIDEDMVDRILNRRYALWGGKAKHRRKLFTSIVAVAASILLIVSAVFVILPYINKQVPVYQGMTVSNNAPAMGEISSSNKADVAKQLFEPYHTRGALNRSLSLLSNVSATHDIDVQETLDNSDRNSSISVSGESYYAQKNEDIYIYVHLSNPDGFEILSFTLNGVKYSSYMFEEGSDMETLVLKLNVGDSEMQMLEYTIDAIKYVDGTEIKDVQMDGERTVQIGVGTEKQPTATITDESIGLTQMQFTVSISDERNMLGAEECRVYAVLYDGHQLVRQQEISNLESETVVFPNLISGKCYQYAIIAEYDAWDGSGIRAHVLIKQTVETLTKIQILDEDVWFGARKFRIETNRISTPTSLEVYQGEVLIRTLPLQYPVVDGLIPGEEYRVVLTYDNAETNQSETVERLFIHQAKQTPVAADGMEIQIAGSDVQLYDPNDGVYKQRPVLHISSEQDVNVRAITSGVITAISSDSVCVEDKLGGYEVEYRNLLFVDENLQVGATVEAGQVLGLIASSQVSAANGESQLILYVRAASDASWKTEEAKAFLSLKKMS